MADERKSARGAAPGTRRGGRTAGTPNKATIERNLIAAQQAAVEAGNPKKPLAKEILEKYMMFCDGMSGVYQPLPPGRDTPENVAAALKEGREPNPELFWKSVEMVALFAKALAPFQSPTYKAIAVYKTPDEQGGQGGPAGGFTTTIEGTVNPPPLPENVTRLHDPLAQQAAYKRSIGQVRG